MQYPNLLLVPASRENLWSIQSGVDINVLEQALKPEELKALQNQTPDREKYLCWAMTESRRKIFSQLRTDDIALFTVKGTRKFGYMGDICFKTENEDLGKRLWKYTPSRPWRLIYFLRCVKAVDIDKVTLVSLLGYDRNYVVPGVNLFPGSQLSNLVMGDSSAAEFITSLTASVPLAPFRPDRPETPKPEPCRPACLEAVIAEVETLKAAPDHQERAHEALVESFLVKLGYQRFEEIKFQTGRVDILLEHSGEVLAVFEVKKRWGLSKNDKATLEQAFRYAQETGARYVIVSNGDYYAWFDRDKGRKYDRQFMREFRLTQLTAGDYKFIQTLKKECLPLP